MRYIITVGFFVLAGIGLTVWLCVRNPDYTDDAIIAGIVCCLVAAMVSPIALSAFEDYP